MSICRVWLRDTSNALMLRMSSEQIRLQVSPKLFGVNSWIPQMIRQWIPDSWSGDRKCSGSKGAAANLRNWQLMTSGRSQVLETSNFRDWHTVVDKISRSSVPKTTMDCHSKLVLHLLRNNQPVQVIVHELRQTTLIFLGPSPLGRKTKQSYNSLPAMWHMHD